MSTTNKVNLDRLVAENCIKLFADYRLDVHAVGAEESLANRPFLVCGVVGFTSKHVRGALALASTSEPLELTSPDLTSHRDWVCELANQLLGRVKNQLLSRKVEVFASTPVALRGEHLSPVRQQGQVADLFITSGGAVCVWMDCEFEPDFELPDGVVEEASPLSEGEMVLF